MSKERDYYFEQYQDRKMKKWAGFYLSEHTALIEREKKRQPAEKKRQMSWSDIDEVLAQAFQNQVEVTIQKEELDSEGNYGADIIGLIQGHDELGLYVGGHKIGYDEIRHVQLY
ncbi:hypothetical protein A5819_000033 [Enterococcus sp. 7E2_DIV0204]|uniref:DNA-directed RNA polymerase beta subunit n=1 Tax=Candidatus Enterococcus lemimoniae TaxID=1834167 RepID=A0ABZ2T5Z6_9ENTE|nr:MULTISPECIES: hypothetical protein [unclassified Enterococcus]OTN87587.1 hypothetical protein A5819_000033 [Enterococcus sp. 7E2_DIV0204]OTO69737.1 hypothetical protein A5866_001953 [Enterococcus sp. 12C11_DIV0727]OTP49727.1 hypothetical protein A5884_002927 [Enterococcus sp. 7D2_DIV0200]